MFNFTKNVALEFLKLVVLVTEILVSDLVLRIMYHAENKCVLKVIAKLSLSIVLIVVFE